jgi:flagellar hook assembly protein FlgD
VATLANERVVGGRAEWDGRMDNGNIVAPGVYQYIIRGKSKVKKGKLLVIH